MFGIPGFAAAGIAFEVRGYATGISQLRRIGTEIRHLGDTTGLVATKSQQLTLALGMLGIAMAAVGTGVAAALRPMVEASDELRRLDIMGRGVASAMAVSTEALLAERKELAQLDVTAVQANRSLNALVLMHLDHAKASDLATAALNIAAFTGAKVSDVYEDLTRAVANASTMGLRAYNIAATSERVYAAYAQTLGKTARELDMVGRRHAVLYYILAVGNRVAGAYAATVETLWGQLQRLRSETGRLAESVGQYLLPRLIDLLQKANALMRYFGTLPAYTQAATIAFMAKAAAIMVAAGAMALLLPVIKLLIAAFAALARILWAVVVEAVFAVAAGVVELVALLGTLGVAGWATAAAIALVVVAIKRNWLGIGDWFDRTLGNWAARIGAWVVTTYQSIKKGLLAPFEGAARAIRNVTGSLSDEDYGFKWPPSEVFDDFADQAERAAKEALWAIQDVLFGLETRALELDKLLYPFEDAITRVRAAADLVVIPLERQRRALERQLHALEKIAKEERKRAEQRLRELEKQEEALRDLVQADQERLDYLDWEIFMEQQRNKVLGREASVRLLEMESQRDVARDQLARRREELSVVSDARRAEKERLDDYQTSAEKQIEALEERIDLLTESIDLEEERVLWAEETLRLEKARHVEARLALLAETRFWQEEQRQAQHALDLIKRVSEEIQAITEDWMFELPGVPVFPLPEVPVPPVLVRPELPRGVGVEQVTPLRGAMWEGLLGPSKEQVASWWAERLQLIKDYFAEERRLTRERSDEAEVEFAAWWGQARAGWSTFWAERLQVVKDYFAGEREVTQQRGEAAGEALKEAWQSFYDSWMTAGQIARAQEDQAWQGLTGRIVSATQTLEQNVATIWGRVQQGWQNYLTWWDGVWARFLGVEVETLRGSNERQQAWVQDTQARWETFKAGAATLWQGYLTWWDGVWAKFLDIEVATLRGSDEQHQAWKQATLERWKALRSGVVLTMQGLYTGVTGYFQQMFASTSLILLALKFYIQAKAWEYYTEITTWVEQARDTIGSKLDEFQIAINTWFEQTGIPAIVQRGIDLVTNLVDAIVDHIKGEATWRKIRSVGETLVSGIQQGIKDKWEDFKTWLEGKIAELPEWLRKFIGAASPAKMTEPIGVALIEGIQVGMQQALQRMARQIGPVVTAEVVPGLGRATSTVAAPTINNYYYITHGAPSVSVTARYAREQSQATIRHDIAMLLAMT